jgi:tape measure domain-containing protein
MSGNLDDLDFGLSVAYEESLRGLRQVVATIDELDARLSTSAAAFDGAAMAGARLAQVSVMPVANITQMANGLQDTAESMILLTSSVRKADDYLAIADAESDSISKHWQYINRDVMSSADSVKRFVTAATAGTAKPVSGLINISAAALAVKAASGMSTAMTKARTAIITIDTSAKTAVLSLDRFRMGLASPAVNPALNTLPGLIEKIAGKAAGAVESLRGFGDATIAGAPAIMGAIASGMQKILGSGDTLQATVSKITSQLDLQRGALDRVAAIYPTTGTAVGILKDAMNFIAPAAEKVAQAVDSANNSVRDAATSARNLAYIATGTFIKTGTSADLYARGAYHALLPTRLLAFEARFAAGNMSLVRRAFAAVTSPIHAVSMAFQRSRGEFRELRANLPPLTGGLQLGTRAMRVFAHGTLAASQTLATLKTAATPITYLATKLWSLVSPAKAASASMAMLKQSISGASAAAGNMASTAVTGGVSKLAGGFKAALIASGAMAAGVIAMSGSVAMATEKNQAVFGVMLKDMEQGKAVVASLQQAKSVGLFDNEEVLNSGRLLFKAGVAAADLAGKTDQLATIAAATSTELSDLTRIYQQGANRGSFQQDKINQFAERGIDIYHALTAVTGKSGEALTKMITDGQIGITEMDAALAHLTEGNGIYAGSLETMGNTTSGMLSRIKNNFMQALGGIGGAGLTAFKPILTGLLEISEKSKGWLLAISPVATQVMMTIRAAFVGIWSVASAAFTGIFGASTATFGGMLAATMSWVTKFRWFFENLVPIVEFVSLSMTLKMVTFFNDISYWFTTKIPAYMTWFKDNWRNVFTDILNGTKAIFSNMTDNIKNAMTQIWTFIKSGGMADLEFTWTPLLEGFKSTVDALPEIPDRAMTELENSLTSQVDALGVKLADSFDKFNMEAQAALNIAAPELPAIDPNLASGATNTEGNSAAGNKRTSFLVSNLEKGSQAALDAIFAGQKDKTPEKQLTEQKMTNKHLAKIANKPSPMVLGAV